jgi:2-dehydro-3-deoxygalactonokinase
MADPVLLAVDWGTTSARVYQVAGDGAVVAEKTLALGVQKIGAQSFPDAFAQLLGDWQDLPLARLASGMIGSRQGWFEAPYIHTPATLRSLAAALVVTPGNELTIVPGVMTRDAAATPDVMRGEETEIFGALDDARANGLFVLPGTHSKWVRVAQGGIADFYTFMTGEIYAVMLAHSILGRLAVPASNAGDAAFSRGVQRGIGAGTITHDLFAARTLVLAGELAPQDVSEFLSGLLIGREVRSGRIWALGTGSDASRVTVVGADDLAERYVTAFRAADVEAVRAPPGTAARGLLRIARAAGMVG